MNTISFQASEAARECLTQLKGQEGMTWRQFLIACALCQVRRGLELRGRSETAYQRDLAKLRREFDEATRRRG